jgi:hypothetical protein
MYVGNDVQNKTNERCNLSSCLVRRRWPANDREQDQRQRPAIHRSVTSCNMIQRGGDFLFVHPFYKVYNRSGRLMTPRPTRMCRNPCVGLLLLLSRGI